MAGRFHSFPGTAAAVARLPGATRRQTHGAPREIRVWLGLSQTAFADALGVSRSTVARWESARVGPDPQSAEGRWLAVLAHVRALATRLWPTPAKARAWLYAPLPVFDGRRPIDVLTREGPITVRDVLLDELEGVYS